VEDLPTTRSLLWATWRKGLQATESALVIAQGSEERSPVESTGLFIVVQLPEAISAAFQRAASSRAACVPPAAVLL